jgi:hypothetical protein
MESIMTTLAFENSVGIRRPRLTWIRWRQLALGNFLLLHALAHTSAIVWASGTAPAWIVSSLWIVALVGYFAAGLGILGAPGFRERWPWLMAAGTFGSLILLALSGNAFAAAGILLDLALIPGAVRWGRHPHLSTRHHPIAWTSGTVLLGWIALVSLSRPVLTQWGTTAAERNTPMFGDHGLTGTGYRIDHAVTIAAPADSVWPWLAQLGQDRGGFYSYDWLERLVGANVHNANRINPEWQSRDVGDFVRATQPGYLGGRLGEPGWRVTAVLPGRAYVLENWGAFILQPVDSSTTRFFVRTRGDGDATLLGVLLGPINVLVFEPAHFIMERRMMLGIRDRAERMMGA